MTSAERGARRGLVARAVRRMEADGVCWAEWARERGFARHNVMKVVRGQRACLHGECYRIAAALGVVTCVVEPGGVISIGPRELSGPPGEAPSRPSRARRECSPRARRECSPPWTYSRSEGTVRDADGRLVALVPVTVAGPEARLIAAGPVLLGDLMDMMGFVLEHCSCTAGGDCRALEEVVGRALKTLKALRGSEAREGELP